MTGTFISEHEVDRSTFGRSEADLESVASTQMDVTNSVGPTADAMSVGLRKSANITRTLIQVCRTCTVLDFCEQNRKTRIFAVSFFCCTTEDKPPDKRTADYFLQWIRVSGQTGPAGKTRSAVTLYPEDFRSQQVNGPLLSCFWLISLSTDKSHG